MRRRWIAAASCLATLCAPASGSAQTPAVPRPSVRVGRIERPRIDGRLDDAGWRDAVEIQSFYQQQPIEGAPATERTEVLLGYDDEHLFVAIRVHYSDLSLLRANRTDRDQTGADDIVTVSLDPFRDAQRAYAFSVNAFGVQADSLLMTNPAGTTIDPTWDVPYQSAAEQVADGWTAEMALPIKSLRYPAVPRGEAHRWALQIQREIRSKNETVTWAPLSSNVLTALGQMGTLEGLADLAPQRTLELMPTFTSENVDTRAASGEAVAAVLNEAGLTVKYGVTSNLTLDATINPDFSQIESDRPQIQINQRFPLFFAELRPFFLDGQEVFRTNGPFPYLHTRTIVDPDFGAKLTGKIGRMTLGALVANDAAPGRIDDRADPAFGKKATVAALRLKYDVYRESQSGVLLVDREFLGTHSRLGMIDNTLRAGATRTLGATIVLTDQRDAAGVTRTGHFLDFGLVTQGRHLGYVAALHSISPDFRNDSGFVQRTDERRWSGTCRTGGGPSGQSSTGGRRSATSASSTTPARARTKSAG